MRLHVKWGGLFIVPAVSTIILLIVAGAQPPAGAPDPHANGKIVVPPNTSEITYCDGCHTTGCPMPHPESVKLTWAANGKTVLGVAGEITCGTCHTRGFKHRSDAYLARDQKGLCNNCHFGAHAIPDLHNGNQSCDSCHIRGQSELAHVSPVVTKTMRPDIDSDCMKCHYDGPVTHPINVPNKKKKAPDLPLSPEGNITCVTCHVGHKDKDKFGQMLRKDNRRGGLCNSCHDDL